MFFYLAHPAETLLAALLMCVLVHTMKPCLDIPSVQQDGYHQARIHDILVCSREALYKLVLVLAAITPLQSGRCRQNSARREEENLQVRAAFEARGGGGEHERKHTMDKHTKIKLPLENAKWTDLCCGGALSLKIIALFASRKYQPALSSMQRTTQPRIGR